MAPSLTRELVIATARRHLEADGLGRFSLRAVARDLEVTAPALYAYVSSKEELVALVAAARVLLELSWTLLIRGEVFRADGMGEPVQMR